MVKVVAKNVVLEENLDKVLKLCEEIIGETRKEDGCISYELFEGIEDPKVVTFIEEWESMEHLEKHFKTPHFERIVPQLGELMAKDGEVDIYQLKM